MIPFLTEKNIEPIVIYGEPLIFNKNVAGEVVYDIQQSHPNYPIKFVVQIIVEVPKDTIFVKPGFKKF